MQVHVPDLARQSRQRMWTVIPPRRQELDLSGTGDGRRLFEVHRLPRVAHRLSLRAEAARHEKEVPELVAGGLDRLELRGLRDVAACGARPDVILYLREEPRR